MICYMTVFELGGLQLRHAGWRFWLCAPYVSCRCFPARERFAAPLGGRHFDLHWRHAGWSDEAAHDGSRCAAKGDGVTATFLLLHFFSAAARAAKIAMTYGMKATGEPEHCVQNSFAIFGSCRV